MNDQKLLEYIASTLDTRAVQVADRFDVELVDASNALRSLVEVGDLVRSQGVAPNGQQAQVYNLSESFKKSNDGKAILQRVAATRAAEQPQLEEKPAQQTPPQALAMPLPKDGRDPYSRRGSGSRLERAVSFICATGKVTNDQLRNLLDMKSFEYPSTVLRPAINDGRIARDGDDWITGTGKPPVKTRRAGPNPKPAPSPEVKASEPPAAVVSVESPLAALPVDAGLRCAVWSDGVIELQRDAKTICLLSRQEALFLASHVTTPGAEHA